MFQQHNERKLTNIKQICSVVWRQLLVIFVVETTTTTKRKRKKKEGKKKITEFSNSVLVLYKQHAGENTRDALCGLLEIMPPTNKPAAV